MFKTMVYAVVVGWFAAWSCIAQAQTTVISGAITIDPVAGESPGPVDIVITNGLISSITPQGTVEFPGEATIVDADGLFAIPGLIDVHTHMSMALGSDEVSDPSEDFLGQMSRYGVTTALNTAWSIEQIKGFRDGIPHRSTPLTELLVVGQSIGHPDGWGGKMPIAGLGPASPAEARRMVAQQADFGVDMIKIVYDDMTAFGMNPPLPQLPRQILSAAIDEAHAHGLKAIVHAPELEDARAALEEGADALIHGIIDEPVDVEFLDLMRSSGAFYSPTHVLYERGANGAAISHRYEALDRRGVIDPQVFKGMFEAKRRHDVTGPNIYNLRSNLIAIHRAGIPVALGTDTGVVGVFPGLASQMELVLYVESVMTPLEALRSATVIPATLLGADKRLGRLAAGYEADLVLLRSNLLQDIRAIADIRAVIIDGVVVQMDEAIPGCAPQR
ncbi:amidohydrolase family protein [Erythrobacter aquimaris]|uniref:Amidohydrolase family protein n=1 Tax=Qipengyuania aquimaris TaxID=255984 RepID=A0A6I4TN49_9SPHN|nr:amidohydrolase family protein [Qipengyuania aquimaris]MXO96511.1 amidohydrolase family protein [Qipengyuania aquimaris]